MQLVEMNLLERKAVSEQTLCYLRLLLDKGLRSLEPFSVSKPPDPSRYPLPALSL